MNIFKRIKNIVRSNINYKNEYNIDIDSYENIYYNDSKNIETENDKEKEYYKILELEYNVGFSEIKKAYKKLLKKYHPDFFQNDSGKLKKAQEVTRQINEAYTYFERKYL